jgi:hypothetical protein
MFLLGSILLAPLVGAIKNLVVFGDSYSGTLSSTETLAYVVEGRITPVKGKNAENLKKLVSELIVHRLPF